MSPVYVEKNRKVHAEQYRAGATPVQAGVCVCQMNASFLMPHVHVESGSGWRALAEGDWIAFDEALTWRRPEVYTPAEFAALFTGPPADAATPLPAPEG